VHAAEFVQIHFEDKGNEHFALGFPLGHGTHEVAALVLDEFAYLLRWGAVGAEDAISRNKEWREAGCVPLGSHGALPIGSGGFRFPSIAKEIHTRPIGSGL